MSISIKWSASLESLADGLLRAWEDAASSAHEPFGKTCIVVNNIATANWLKQYYLVDRKIRRVMLGLDFVALPEFANDWLAAQVHGIAPRERKASLHPYSKEVMAWRIYRRLDKAEEGDGLEILRSYVGTEPQAAGRRRWALSGKIARMLDEYQDSRFMMLRNWETGGMDRPDDAPAWQKTLYRLLVAENDGTYARDYDAAFQTGAEAAEALRHGFPRYQAVHVFDISFMPEPTLRLLEKIAEALPVTFWTFNPLDDWLGETPSRAEAVQRLRRQLKRQRTVLSQGGVPEEVEFSLDSSMIRRRSGFWAFWLRGRGA